MSDYYSPWVWIPIEEMPDGCTEVIVRDIDTNVMAICSCDYWWMKQDDKKRWLFFRYDF